MKVAVVGCCHGELNTIYAAVAETEHASNIKIDLLLVGGDFQSIRNNADFVNLCVPKKFQKFGDFHEYYSGKRTAPVLTLFVGGNHESSAFLWELYYGGWIAPNIYFLGWANVVRFGNLRIGGASGIFKPHDYFRGNHERAPYGPNDLRSIYHMRHLDIFRLTLYKSRIDIFLSHDWPRHIAHYGDTQMLLKKKRFFLEDILSGNLGAPPLQHLLQLLAPRYWFAAHLHVKFAAIVPPISTEYDAIDMVKFNHTRKFHRTLESGIDVSCADDPKATRFLALDKCLPNRHFLQVLDVSEEEMEDKNDSIKVLKYDPEWLAILRATASCHRVGIESDFSKMLPLLNNRNEENFMWNDEISIEKEWIEENLIDLVIPNNFEQTAPAGGPNFPNLTGIDFEKASKIQYNPQTDTFCTILGIKNMICGEGLMLKRSNLNKETEENQYETTNQI